MAWLRLCPILSVGALIVYKNQIIGEGFTSSAYGGAHASERHSACQGQIVIGILNPICELRTL